MRHGLGLALAGGLLLSMASRSDAQFSITIGNPFGGQGFYTGSGYYGGVGSPGYGSGYGGYGYPAYGVNSYTSYGSGYRGYATPAYGGSMRPYGSGYGGYRYPAYGGSLPAYGTVYNNTFTSGYGAGVGTFGYSSAYRGFAGPGVGNAYGYGGAPVMRGYEYRPVRPFGLFNR